MAIKSYNPPDQVPLPPKDADVLTTACDYCIVACGYKVYRWSVGTEGGMKASENAFNKDFPVGPKEEWVAPTQHNIVTHNGELHNIIVIGDRDTKAVNFEGDTSIRGGTLAGKCYNPETATKDRLMDPMVRINGILEPVSWDFAIDIAATLGRHVWAKHGANAYSVKTFSYQYMENTYAITKYARRHLKTASFAWHDTPADVTSTPGFRDTGIDNFGPAYKDWADAEVLMICGTDPWETKSILFQQHILPSMEAGTKKCIVMNPRKTPGVAYIEKMGGIHLDIDPGTDLVVVNAIARYIVEQGWEDSEWIKKWVNNKWETDSGFGQGTRNTPWQWRTTWGKLGSKGFEDWKKNFILKQDTARLSKAAKIANIDPKKIIAAAKMLAKPINGRRPKTSIGIEKGFYWSNNTGNTEAIGALSILVGAGGRPGQMTGRFGGHQRGGLAGGKYPRNKSPEKRPGRRRRSLNTDQWLVSGHTRFAHVIGTTWIQSMTGSHGLAKKFDELVTNNPHQVTSRNKNEIIATLKKRADSGGMVVVNQDIYLVDPIGAKYADVVFPASTWGENDFTRANGERRIRLYSKFYDAPGNSKPDWEIISLLAKGMGLSGFDWKNSNDVLEEASRFSRGSRKDFYMVKIDAKAKGITLHERFRQFGTTGIQAPVHRFAGKLVESIRLHDTTRKLPFTGAEAGNIFNKKTLAFNSQTGKMNMMKGQWDLFSDFWEWLKPRGNELWSSNGRTNELWQSMFDDNRQPYKQQRNPYQFVEIHPEDARKRGITSGDLVLVYSNRVPVSKNTFLGVKDSDFTFTSLMKNGHIEIQKASIKAVAMVVDTVKKGVVFTNFLDKENPSNALQNGVVDQVSGNYNYKMGVCKIKRIGESPYKKDMHFFSFAPRNIV